MNSNSTKNILIVDRFALEAEIQLKKKFNVIKLAPELVSASEQKTTVQKANALVIRSKFKVDEEILKYLHNLELVITCTSGYDHIDLKATEAARVKVAYTPDANISSAAELTWSLLLAARKNLLGAHREVKSGGWNRDLFSSHELAGQTLGIVGLGRIGGRVAKIAKAFEMKTLAFDPYQDEKVFNQLEVNRVSYEELLKQSDIITFHVPATFETKHMFSRSQIEFVSPDLIVINASRGSVIHEDDVIEALNTGQLKFAALDVFNKEPLGRDSKLLKSDRVLLTPHLGGYTHESFLKASMEAAQRIEEFFLQNKLVNSLPLQNDWGSLSFSERT